MDGREKFGPIEKDNAFALSFSIVSGQLSRFRTANRYGRIMLDDHYD